MLTGETVDCISAEDVAAALADSDLGRLLQAVTLGSSSWADEANRGSLVKECTADGECVCGRPEECPLRSNAVLAQHALGQLAQRATTGQLQLARSTVGAMQLLALLREALRWRQHAAANAFVALAAFPGAPQLPLTWWRNLLVIALRSSVPQQLPALRGIVSLCNEAAAREGKPALPPAPNCRSLSVLDASFPHRRQHAAAPFPALAEILSSATGIAEHVRIEDLYRACDNDSLPELLRLGPPPSPAASMLAWSKVMQWGACSLHMRLQTRGSRPAHDWALPTYVRFADALDALVAAGHRPRSLWGVELHALNTPAQRLEAYNAMLAVCTQPLRTLDWLTALAASGLEWTPASHKRWPPAIQEAVEVAFGPGVCRPVCKRAARPATSARWPLATPTPAAAVPGPSPKQAPASVTTGPAAAAARSAGAAGRAPGSQPAHGPQASSQPATALQQLPVEIQERIAGLIVRPISRWLLLPGGTLGETQVPS